MHKEDAKDLAADVVIYTTVTMAIYGYVRVTKGIIKAVHRIMK